MKNEVSDMQTEKTMRSNEANRRDFLRTTVGAAAALSAATSVPFVHAGEDNTLKIALVGCGSRGTGAAVNALSTTSGPTQLVAMADVFPQRVELSLKNIKKTLGDNADKVQVSKDRCFAGFDAYRKAIDAVSPGGVVLLATPPAFRPIHVEYAIARGNHLFMEKSFAVDAPGLHRVLKAGKEADQKNLKIASGLMSRHYLPLEQAIEQIHNGLIGDVITEWAYREHGPVGFSPKKAGQSELAHQIENYSCFTWLNGTFFLDWLIHNLDICCWLKDAWPVSAQGQGGRQVRDVPDQLFDHYAVEFSFPDGTRLFAQGRHLNGCWDFFGDVIHGTKGSAVLGEGISNPKIYKTHKQDRGNVIWQYKGEPCNHYQREHDLFFAAIRQDKPYNETERAVHAAMTGILGRMAAESGKKITWDEAFQSQKQLAPDLEKLASLDDPAPVMPDANGRYPIAMPGITEVL
jgi:predicted dehydrogenase